jgi:acyl dehydratase
LVGQTGLVAVGDTAEKVITLTEQAIIDFALHTGDLNPLHSDRSYAEGTRFGGIIACGGQMVALYMGLVATTFSRKGAMLGLNLDFRIPAPTYPNQELQVRLEVLAVEYHAKLNGDLVTITGGIFKSAGDPVLLSDGKIVVMERFLV